MLGARASYLTWSLINVSLGARYHSVSLMYNMGSVRYLCEGSTKCSLGSAQCSVSTKDVLIECHLMMMSIRVTSECLLPALGEWHISFLLFTTHRLFAVQEFLQSAKLINSSYWLKKKNKIKQCLEIPWQHWFSVSENTRRACKSSFWEAQTLTQPQSPRRVQSPASNNKLAFAAVCTVNTIPGSKHHLI